MKRYLSILYFYFFCLQLASGQLPYVVSYANIAEEVKEIWYDEETGESIVVTVDRLCKLIPSDIRCKTLNVGHKIMSNNQTFDRSIKDPILISKYGEFFELKENGVFTVETQGSFPNAAVFKDNEDFWVAGYRIYRFRSDGTTDTIPVIMNTELPYWDIRKQSENYIWFLNYGTGIYKIDVRDNTIKRFSSLNGLPTNNVTCLHIDDKNQIYAGLKSGIIRINENQSVKSFDLRSYIGNETIKEIESDGSGNLWFLSDKKLGVLNPETSDVRIIPTNNNEDLVIHTLEYNPMKDMMLIGSSHGLFISSSQGKFYTNENLYANGSMYYFGDELLVSDGKKVRKMNDETGRFEHTTYRPVKQTLQAKDGNNWINDGRYAILLSAADKKVLRKIRLPNKRVNQITQHNDEVYFAHDQGIDKYAEGKMQSVVNEGEAFYNVIICKGVVYAISEKGIYRLEGNEVSNESVIEDGIELLKSNKQFFINENDLLIPSTKAIISANCHDDGVEFKVFPSLDTIIDFHYHNESIYILFSDRLAMFNAQNYLKDPYDSYCVVPANANENSKIFVDKKDNIWINNEFGLAAISPDNSKICNILPQRYDVKESAIITNDIETEPVVTTDSFSFFKKSLHPSLYYLIALFIIFLIIVFLLLIFRSR